MVSNWICVEQVRGKALGQLVHLGADPIGQFQGVGVGELPDRQADRGPAVQPAADVLVFGPQLDAAHVPHPDEPAVATVGAEDDIRELGRLDEPAERARG